MFNNLNLRLPQDTLSMFNCKVSSPELLKLCVVLIWEPLLESEKQIETKVDLYL